MNPKDCTEENSKQINGLRSQLNYFTMNDDECLKALNLDKKEKKKVMKKLTESKE